MSRPQCSKQLRDPLRDLIDRLLHGAFATGERSLGVVGPAARPPQPPAQCLRSCLDGDPGQLEARGCPWLHQAAAGRLESGLLESGVCARGFHVAGQTIRLDGSSGVLVAIEEHRDGRKTRASLPQLPSELESLSQALEQVSQLVKENEGLADEVLRNYEQLNLIFEFTQQIVTYTDANEIEKALLDRLGGLLGAQTVLVSATEGRRPCYDVSRGELISASDATRLIEGLSREIEHVRCSRTVSVHNSPIARVVLGPLVRLDDRVDAVLAIRPSYAGEFTSGDMLMIESLLSFGGQIISNSEIHERLRRMSLESTRALVAAIDKKDHYTSGHSERVGFLARLTGQRMGIPAHKLQILEMVGLLHDVGKIGIPEGILCKPGKLTNDEYDVIKCHPGMGYEILRPVASFGDVLDGVLYHHENPDGSGYPKGLVGDQIPLYARIIHVVDVFDALTSTRSYRTAFSLERSREIIHKEAGTKLDAEVVKVFLELLPTLQTECPEQLASVSCCEEEVTDAVA